MACLNSGELGVRMCVEVAYMQVQNGKAFEQLENSRFRRGVLVLLFKLLPLLSEWKASRMQQRKGGIFRELTKNAALWE